MDDYVITHVHFIRVSDLDKISVVIIRAQITIFYYFDFFLNCLTTRTSVHLLYISALGIRSRVNPGQVSLNYQKICEVLIA